MTAEAPSVILFRVQHLPGIGHFARPAARALPRRPVEIRLDGAESFARALPGLLAGPA